MTRDLISDAMSCASCTACEGAGFQTPPVMFAGNPRAPILAIGQNPGAIKSSDEERKTWIETFAQVPPGILGPGTPLWYFWDFTTSPGYKRLGAVFGEDWLQSGDIVWSNAVRCRTPNNQPPTPEMVSACSVWTKFMIEGRKAIITVGAVATEQVVGDKASSLGWGVPRRHPTLGVILAIKHYSAWKPGEAEGYQRAYEKVLETI